MMSPTLSAVENEARISPETSTKIAGVVKEEESKQSSKAASIHNAEEEKVKAEELDFDMLLINPSRDKLSIVLKATEDNELSQSARSSRRTRTKSETHLSQRPSIVELEKADEVQQEQHFDLSVSDDASSFDLSKDLYEKAQQISDHYIEVKKEWDSFCCLCCFFNETQLKANIFFKFVTDESC